MRNVRFLVVDDSAMARSLVASVIRARLGTDRIAQAADGKQAILLLEQAPVDIIISDLAMGLVNGDELLAYVRRNERFKHMPFIMLSAHSQREQIVHAFQLGVTHYLVKPFTPAELEQRIRSSWNAASRRSSERHASLPRHRAALRLGEQTFAAELLDLSRSGAQLRVKYSGDLGIYLLGELTILFSDPATGRQWNIPRLTGTTVRLEADGDAMCVVALRFDETPAEAASPLDELLHWLAAREPALING